jgi:hypothetical protein
MVKRRPNQRDGLDKAVRLLPLAFLAMIACGHAATVSVNPNAALPVPARLQNAAAKIVGPNWIHYRPFMVLYPVKSPSNTTVLFVLALNADKADAAHSLVFLHGKPVPGDNSVETTDPIPLPVVITTDGAVLATIQWWFPTFDPGSTEISFSSWHQNFPEEMSLRITDPTVSAPHSPYCPPPFLWNGKAHKFIEATGTYYGKCR